MRLNSFSFNASDIERAKLEVHLSTGGVVEGHKVCDPPNLFTELRLEEISSYKCPTLCNTVMCGACQSWHFSPHTMKRTNGIGEKK